ncbi:MAG: excinuclease ABC subunit A [Verrucomicrobia bacterium]|nr:MAG: excinuclease ABC subunit A [Verrucomicrobiota bacterium]
MIAPARNACVEIRGARQNNLKGIDVDLPLGKLTVVTGPSGSGKSSLAFETIYAEGQRRYVETFSPYMRQFLDRMDKPRVDDIRGIPPAIAIEQANPVKTSRSTVGTMTEINDYLKLLWPRVSRAFCPSCGRQIRPETAQSIAGQVLCHFERSREIPSRNQLVTPRDSSTSPATAGSGRNDGTTVLITFWISVPPKTEPRKFFDFLQQQGYVRVWIDNQIVRVDDADPKIKRLGARVQVIQDRIAISEENRARLVEAIETALRFGKGKINIIPISENAERRTSNTERPANHRPVRRSLGEGGSPLTSHEFPFSTGWHCAWCDLDIRPPTPGLFSFNNPLGACPECRGFGRTISIDLNKAIPNRRLSIKQGVVRVFRGAEFGESQKDLLRACARKEIDVNVPFEELPRADQDFVIEGDKRSGEYTEEDYEHDRWYGVSGFFRWLESKTYKMHVRVLLSRYRAYITCPKCNGGRYQPETLNYKCSATVPVASLRGKLALGRVRPTGEPEACVTLTLPEFQALSIADASDFLRAIEISSGDKTAQMLRDEICSRLDYLCEVGVGYLTLDRSTRTLSGGEVQRVNLTTCLGASLANTLFVMDEPSIGLHPRDVGQLVRVMHNLRDKGNTLLVVEHEEQIIRAADNLIDLGPGRGEHGGELMWNGPLESFVGQALRLPSSRMASDALALQRQSLTRDYLVGRKTIPLPKSRRSWTSSIKVTGARQHNLKNIDVDLPLGVFACVTGVSGSGKSTLIHDVLHRNLLRAKGQSTDHQPSVAAATYGLAGAPGTCKSVTGAHQIGEVVMVDQSPLARTPRSTPILYLGLFDRVRELFAAQPEAMAQGLTAAAFSFNSGSGRCERCSGTGFEKVEMQFLSDLFVRCAECEGKRFQPHVLKVRLHGKSIHNVLELTVSEAIQFFAQIDDDRGPQISSGLKVLEEVGLGYLQLGQPLNTLSGGESQRLKLVRHLAETENAQRPTSNAQRPNGEAIGNLFIFDEPTTGLHFDDVAMLLRLFQRLVDRGHSIVVIEHNLEVIKCADWIIDLGPEAGDAGGEVVATGTPEEIARIEGSHTGKFLAQVLGEGSAGMLPAVRGILPRIPRRRIYAAQDDELSLRAAEEPPGASRMLALPKNRNGAIHVHGAREHNLKNIDVKIPREQLVVITGLSGSGKSTLAFDILFAEGQRRFLDSMSPYARQFVEQLEKPDVDLVSGLPPSVAIEQRVTRGGGKSTVATVTEVYHFLRLLFAKTGTQFCPDCDLPVAKQSVAAIVKQIEAAAKRGPLKVLAPLVKARKGFYTDVAHWAARQGFDTLYVDGKLVPISRFRKLERFKEHTIDVVVDVIDRKRIANARDVARRALEIGRGTARLLDSKNRLTVVSTEMSCPNCGRAFEELDPRLFSFNSPHGACEECGGFGEIWDQDLQTAADRDGESVLENELAAERESEWIEEGEARECPSCRGSRLNAVARHVRVQGYAIDQFTNLSASEATRAIGRLKFKGAHETIAAGLIPEIQQRLRFMETVGLGYLALGRSAKTLSGGESQRIRLAAQLGSNLRGVLYVLDEPTIGLHARDNMRLLETLTALRNKGNSLIVVEHDEETMRRADHIVDLGPRAGVHGGEVVATGTLRDIEKNPKSETARCLKTPLRHPIRGSRRSLRDVENWIEVHRARANNLKDINVRFPIGRLSVITGISGSGKSTLMHDALLPQVREHLGSARASPADRGASPRSSGGQMGLFEEKVRNGEGAIASTRGACAPQIEAVYEVDQSPIGKTSRSTPGTYVKVFDEVRNLYAQLPVSRVRGYSASRFSFNAEGGRCETCKGQGVIKLEMNFLPRSYVPCEDCDGRRYNPQTLEVLYNGKSIGDLMEITIEEAAQFFSAHPKIARALSLLVDTGLGYLKLGQPSPTLSGGEAQRLKLVTQLKRGVSRAADERIRKMRTPGSTLYLLEEPTIGLHMADIELLLNVLHRLVDEGNTVIVIEHNLSVIAEADYIVDLGPEAGDAGGKVVATGTPEQIAKNRVSRTAPFLRKVLNRSRVPVSSM